MTTERTLTELDRLVGAWTTEATHPKMPGLVVHGTVEVTWLEGKRFLIHRARTDHPDFPDSISIVGYVDRDRMDAPPGGASPEPDDSDLTMHYYDSRGVARVYEVSIDDDAWRIWRTAPGFSQRFTGTFAAGGDIIAGTWELCEDDVRWEADLGITYRRR
jgi:hypothetical protein